MLLPRRPVGVDPERMPPEVELAVGDALGIGYEALSTGFDQALEQRQPGGFIPLRARVAAGHGCREAKAHRRARAPRHLARRHGRQPRDVPAAPADTRRRDEADAIPSHCEKVTVAGRRSHRRRDGRKRRLVERQVFHPSTRRHRMPPEGIAGPKLHSENPCAKRASADPSFVIVSALAADGRSTAAATPAAPDGAPVLDRHPWPRACARPRRGRCISRPA